MSETPAAAQAQTRWGNIATTEREVWVLRVSLGVQPPRSPSPPSLPGCCLQVAHLAGILPSFAARTHHVVSDSPWEHCPAGGIGDDGEAEALESVWERAWRWKMDAGGSPSASLTPDPPLWLLEMHGTLNPHLALPSVHWQTSNTGTVLW